LFGLTALGRNINSMTGIILFGILVWVTGRYPPFKNHKNNILEALFLLNLLVIFTSTALPHKGASNIIITISVSLAMFKLFCIIVLHIKDILCNVNSQRCRCSYQINK